MKRILKTMGILIGLAILAVAVMAALLPWMDRWGATDDEIAASFPGDELVPSPRIFYNRAVTIHAAPEEIYPWIVQVGAEKGGMYSYEWFETNILQCELINADRVHEEWQGLKVGDPVKMCPGTSGPPPMKWRSWNRTVPSSWGIRITADGLTSGNSSSSHKMMGPLASFCVGAAR